MRIYPFDGIRGRFTWECEGSANPHADKFNMFDPHVPGEWSGVTVCGYDFYQNRNTLESDLAIAGLTSSNAREIYITFSKRKGTDALCQLNARENWWPEWGNDARAKLFEIAYDRIEADVQRIHEKPDFIQKYGQLPELPLWVWVILVDLRFRGDYTPAIREVLIPPIMAGDWPAFMVAIYKHENWPKVPKNRQQRRASYALEGYESMLPVVNYGVVVAEVENHLQQAKVALDKIGA